MSLVLCIRPAALPRPVPAFKGEQTALVSQAVGPGSWRQWTDPWSSGRKWPWAPSDPVNLLFRPAVFSFPSPGRSSRDGPFCPDSCSPLPAPQPSHGLLVPKYMCTWPPEGGWYESPRAALTNIN